ncbi:MAG: TetR/AcrR family transcriptional regulator [Alkalispirochaetaceae bacterium]
MLQDQQLSSRDLILDTAEQLFVEKGYRGVRLKNVAELVGIRQASLYYHFPGGKRELYAEVMRRSFARKQAGIREAIRQAGSHWRDQLDGATRWLLSQTLYDYRRMFQSDLPELAREDADRLAQEAYTALHQPIEEVFALGSQQEGLLLYRDHRRYPDDPRLCSEPDPPRPRPGDDRDSAQRPQTQGVNLLGEEQVHAGTSL